MDIQRRCFLGGILNAILGCEYPIKPKESFKFDNHIGLSGYAKNNGLIFGSAFDIPAIVDKKYSDLIKNNCAILTTDYNLKFKPLRRNSKDADFTFADKLIVFAEENNKLVRGHTLIWNEGNPNWLNNSTRAERIYWLDRHISEVVERYCGRMHSWDVVNEPFWPGHNNINDFRGGPWFDALGESYISRAFKLAYSLDSRTPLVVNEAWVERSDILGDRVRKGLFNLIEKLLDSGIKLSAVGLQCHLRPMKSLDLAKLSDFIFSLRKFPIDVYITELDIDDDQILVDYDQKIAKIYFDFFEMIKMHDNVKLLSVWQLSDKYSFYREKYNRSVRGMLFDENMKPKLAVEEFIKSFG